MNEYNQHLDDWASSILADPVSKRPCSSERFPVKNGVLDARVFLKNSAGYAEWIDGQDEYEVAESEGAGYKNHLQNYLNEIDYDRPVYEKYRLVGDILDVGGGVGTVREFLPDNSRYVSADPYINAPFEIPKPRLEAYKSLGHPLNFISAMAEFLPFQPATFDWVHMRSMLDHVQVPDLCLKEARRVLKDDGSLLIGLYVEGGKTGRRPFDRFIKDCVKATLGLIGFEKYKDHHVWHPTYKGLIKLVTDNGFEVAEEYWQPYWKDQVVYIRVRKSPADTA